MNEITFKKIKNQVNFQKILTRKKSRAISKTIPRKFSVLYHDERCMVGEGVLHECVLSDKVSSILVLVRKSCGYEHYKINEIIINDFKNLSGQGTDSTEKGFYMWARVKGKTENELSKLAFKKVYNFRPGYMHPIPGLKNTLSMYNYIKIFYPLMKVFTPNSVSKLGELGQARIKSIVHIYPNITIEVIDILKLAKS